MADTLSCYLPDQASQDHFTTGGRLLIHPDTGNKEVMAAQVIVDRTEIGSLHGVPLCDPDEIIRRIGLHRESARAFVTRTISVNCGAPSCDPQDDSYVGWKNKIKKGKKNLAGDNQKASVCNAAGQRSSNHSLEIQSQKQGRSTPNYQPQDQKSGQGLSGPVPYSSVGLKNRPSTV